MDLDQLLADAAPAQRRSAEVEAALRSMVDDARSTNRPARRRTWLVGAVAVPAVIGGAAVAGAVAPSWIHVPWTTQEGRHCKMDFAVTAAGPDGEVNMLPKSIDRAHQRQLLADATAYLAGLDYASISEKEAIESWNADQRRIEAGGGDADHLSGDELAITAVGRQVWQRMDAHLANLGYDMSTTKGSDLFLLAGSQAWRCGE